MIKNLPSFVSFPPKKPDVTPDDHGWFGEQNAEMLSWFLNHDTKLVIELGSWVGKSTRFILDHAPTADVIAIDHWKGSPEHLKRRKSASLLPTLFDTFIVNCWNYQDRLFPLRNHTVEGLKEIHAAGLEPDLIYIDAGHDFESVASDLAISMLFFPKARLTGDDWTWEPVRKAVQGLALENNREAHSIGPAWWISD